jgi:ABC-type transporter Mla MlaB component
MGPVDNAVTLALQGTLTISRVDELRAEILEAIHTHPSVAFDCAQAEEIDVAFLQLLIGANRTAEKLGKTVRFLAPPSALLADAIARCGFPAVPPTTSLAQTFSLPI